MKTRYHLLYLLLFTPNLLFAHGEQVIETLFIDVTVLFILMLFIVTLKWTFKGKIILMIVLIFSEITLQYGLNLLPYEKNKTLINGLSFIVPIIVFVGSIKMFKQHFSRK